MTFESSYQPSRAIGFLIAALAVLAATVIRYSLDSVMQAPFPTFFVAVLIAAYFGGPRPALLATALSAVMAYYFFFGPPAAFKASITPSESIRLFLFLSSGAGISALSAVSEKMRRAAVSAEAQLAEARVLARADAEFRAREAFMRSVMDSLPHEIAVIDANGFIIAVNERWRRFAGDDGRHAIGGGVNYLDACRGAADSGDTNARDALEGLERLLSGEQAEFFMEYPCHSPERERWFLMYAALAEAAARAAVVISHTDITERVRAERRLRDATEQLIEADRRKDFFLAALAHELRNPLAPIRSSIHLLKLHAGPEGRSPRDEKLLAMVDRQVDHLIRLVDDLLDVSRITRDKITLEKTDLDLAEILQASLDMARPSLERAGHRLEVETPRERIIVNGDRVRLTQVFTNLIDNAAKYTQPGGLISLKAALEDGQAVVTVRDTGMGIPKEMLDRIFELFIQVDTSHGRAQGGLGVGLSLVRTLLAMHGGSIEAQSEGLGHGSVFTVRLPAWQASPAS